MFCVLCNNLVLLLFVSASRPKVCRKLEYLFTLSPPIRRGLVLAVMVGLSLDRPGLTVISCQIGKMDTMTFQHEALLIIT